MKVLKVELLPELDNKTLQEISYLIDTKLTYEYIDILNWPQDYSYKPLCRFKIARTATMLYIRFYVNEQNVKAQYINDMDSVWEDSCVEFFCKHPEATYYFNFEFNCIGACLATKRTGRNENIVPFTSEELMQIERYTSLKKDVVHLDGNASWTLTVGIPFALIGFLSDVTSKTLMANFYKCGDTCKTPHYLSWNLIVTETPDFHQPDFFGKLTF